jgi:hypothetical protein
MFAIRFSLCNFLCTYIASVMDPNVVSSILSWAPASLFLPETRFHTRMKENIMNVLARVSAVAYILHLYVEGS